MALKLKNDYTYPFSELQFYELAEELKQMDKQEVIESLKDLGAFFSKKQNLADLMELPKDWLYEAQEEAYQLFQKGRYTEAKSLFLTLVMYQPRDAYLYTALGAVSQAQNELSQAYDYYDRAIQLEPTNANALVNKADLLMQVEEYDDCEKHLEQALTLTGTDQDAFVKRAQELKKKLDVILINKDQNK